MSGVVCVAVQKIDGERNEPIPERNFGAWAGALSFDATAFINGIYLIWSFIGYKNG